LAQRRGYGFTDAGLVVYRIVRGFVHILAFQFEPGILAELDAHFVRYHTPLIMEVSAALTCLRCL
jgi:hypothetical protein